MKIVRSTLLMIVILLLFSFGVFNGQLVRIRFFAWHSPEMPLFLVLIFVFAVGFALALFWSAFRTTGKKRSGKGKADKGETTDREGLGGSHAEKTRDVSASTPKMKDE